MLTYGSERLVEEASYIAWHLHWPLDQILDLEHSLRREFIACIGELSRGSDPGAAGDDREPW